MKSFQKTPTGLNEYCFRKERRFNTKSLAKLTHFVRPHPGYFAFIHIKEPPSFFCSSGKSLLVVLQKSRSCLPKKFGPLQLDPSESLSYKRKQIKEPNQKHFTYTAEEEKLVEGIFRAALPEREFVRGRRAEAPSDTQQPVSNSGAAAFLHAVARAARCAISASDSTWQPLLICFAARPPERDPCQKTSLSVWGMASG